MSMYLKDSFAFGRTSLVQSNGDQCSYLEILVFYPWISQTFSLEGQSKGDISLEHVFHLQFHLRPSFYRLFLQQW